MTVHKQQIRIALYLVFFSDLNAFAFFHINFCIDEVLIIMVRYSIICKYILCHLLARSAPGSISVNKNEFVFFQGLSLNLIKSAMLKGNVFGLRNGIDTQ